MNTRVTLRPLKSSDAEAFMSWGGDPLVTQSLFWDAHPSVEAARTFLVQVAEKHPWFMAICLDGQPIGAVTLDRGTGRSACRAELGYVLSRELWGKGIATEACLQALARGFSDLGVVRIEAIVDPENFGSLKVLEKAGMSREAYFKNYVIHRSKIRSRYVYAKTIG